MARTYKYPLKVEIEGLNEWLENSPTGAKFWNYMLKKIKRQFIDEKKPDYDVEKTIEFLNKKQDEYAKVLNWGDEYDTYTSDYTPMIIQITADELLKNGVYNSMEELKQYGYCTPLSEDEQQEENRKVKKENEDGEIIWVRTGDIHNCTYLRYKQGREKSKGWNKQENLFLAVMNDNECNIEENTVYFTINPLVEYRHNYGGFLPGWNEIIKDFKANTKTGKAKAMVEYR